MARQLRVGQHADGMRADAFLALKLGRVSRTRARRLVDLGDLERDGRPLKPASRVRVGRSSPPRKMVQGAAYLVDRALPHQPFRQWTFALPWDLARRVAFDRSLCGAVFGIFTDSVQRWYEAAGRTAGLEDPSGGCVLQIQRFADGATL